MNYISYLAALGKAKYKYSDIKAMVEEIHTATSLPKHKIRRELMSLLKFPEY